MPQGREHRNRTDDFVAAVLFHRELGSTQQEVDQEEQVTKSFRGCFQTTRPRSAQGNTTTTKRGCLRRM